MEGYAVQRQIIENDNKSRKFFYITAAFSALVPEYFSFALAFIALCIFMRDIRKQILKFRITGCVAVMVAYLAWRFIGIFYSADIFGGAAFFLMWLLMFFGAIIPALVIDSVERLERTSLLLTLSGGFAGGVGIVQILLFHYGKYIHPDLRSMFNPFWNFFNVAVAKIATLSFFPQWLADRLPRSEPIHIFSRANSTFTNPVFFAIFIIMVIPFAVYCLFELKDKRLRALSFFCLACMVCGIALSYTRSAYLALAAVVVVMIFMGKRQAICVAVLSPLMLFAFPSGVYKRLLSIFDFTDVSISTRLNIWEAAVDIIKENPVFGIGTGFEPFRKILVEEYSIKQPHAHNIALQTLVENGAIGLLLLAVFAVYFLVEMIKICRKSKKFKALGVTFIASAAGLFVCSVTDYPFYGPKLLQYFFIIAGLSQAARLVSVKVEKEEKPKEEKLAETANK